MNLTRITSTLGAGAVAGIAAWSSWSHMVHVATGVGERPEVAYVLPLSVDGLLVVSAAAMTDDKRAGRTPRMSARVAFAVGVAATIAANIASAQPSWGARAVAAWPAVALLLVVELLSRRGRTAVSAVEPRTAPAGPPRRRTSARTSPRTSAAALAAQRPDITPADLVRLTGVTPRHARRVTNGRSPAETASTTRPGTSIAEGAATVPNTLPNTHEPVEVVRHDAAH